MAIPTRVIRRRIKSIRSTSKIMKAMELVAASKMRKAVQQTLATRPYARLIREMVEEIRHVVDPTTHPLFVGVKRSEGESQRTLVIVAASDRGLCGGFNGQLIKKAVEFLKSRTTDDVRLVTIGRRAETVSKRGAWKLDASFPSISNAPSFEGARPVSAMAAKEFLEGRVDRVFVAYTDFHSAVSQAPMVIQLLPIVPEAELPRTKTEEEQEEEVEKGWYGKPQEQQQETDSRILFEPSADDVLRGLLPRMIEIRIYQALLESSASEHSARMMAMRSAGDAASDMLDGLTLTLNQARQAAITREISEISAGKAAIE